MEKKKLEFGLTEVPSEKEIHEIAENYCNFLDAREKEFERLQNQVITLREENDILKNTISCSSLQKNDIKNRLEKSIAIHNTRIDSSLLIAIFDYLDADHNNTLRVESYVYQTIIVTKNSAHLKQIENPMTDIKIYSKLKHEQYMQRKKHK